MKKKFLTGKLQTTFAVYRIDRENIGITDRTGFLLEPGDQESRGVEVDIAAEPLPRFRIFFAYAYNDSELTKFFEEDLATGDLVDRSGNKAPYAPENLLNLWLSKSFRSGFGVGGGARYFSEQYFNAANTFEIDGATVLNAALFYDLPNWRFQLNFDNLTDAEYETGSFASSSVVPAPGSRIYGTVEFRF